MFVKSLQLISSLIKRAVLSEILSLKRSVVETFVDLRSTLARRYLYNFVSMRVCPTFENRLVSFISFTNKVKSFNTFAAPILIYLELESCPALSLEISYWKQETYWTIFESLMRRKGYSIQKHIRLWSDQFQGSTYKTVSRNAPFFLLKRVQEMHKSKHIINITSAIGNNGIFWTYQKRG